MPRAYSSIVAVLLIVCAGPALAEDVGPLGARPIDDQASQTVTYDGHKLVRVDLQTQADLDLLLSLRLDIWSDYIGVGSLPVRVAPDQMQDLDESGLAYEVLNHDLGPAARRHLDRPVTRGTWDDYMTLAEIIAFINDLETTYPTLCEVSSIGTSLEGRDIWVLHITGTPSGSKPAVFYHSLIHCREWLTAPVVLYLADHLTSNYGSDPDVTALVDGVDIYLAPCANPDGFVYTWTSERYWRKNRRNNGDGTYGVDLNRNWGYEWGYDNYGSSPYTYDETYRGPYAFSEPETQVLSSFITADPNILAYMDYHTYQEMILWPWGYDYLGGPPEPDGTEFNDLGDTMQSLIQSVHGVYYEAGPIAETLSTVNGDTVDWVYGAEGRFAFSIELRPGPGAGLEGFSPPPSEILPTCQENLPAILHLTEWALDQVGVTFTFPNGLPEALAPFTPEVIDVEIVPLYEEVVPASPTLHYRYDGGTYQTAPLTFVSGNLYQATLPAAGCDDTPEYYFSAAGSVTGPVYDPADAPTVTYTVPVGEFETLFADNFQTDTGWTTDTVNSPTSGLWERGTPVNDPSWEYDPTSDSDGSGQCYLTQNELGNTDVDGGNVLLISPALDMSDGNISISYDYFLRLSNTTGGVDRLLVEINNDGGSGTWTEIARHDTNGGLTWRNHVIDQDDLDAAGVTLTSNMVLRFDTNDADPQSINESGLDAFVVSSFRCAFVPGDANQDGDVDLADYPYFTDCLGGPDQPIPPTCTVPTGVFDFDEDGDVDIDDFREFQTVFESY